MKIYGFQKTSLQDYPGKVSSIIFTKGCNFRCGYCHNPELIPSSGEGIDHTEIFSFLDKRKKLIDGVVVTGGEPTIQKGLLAFLQKVKALGYAVKLDTNGSMPSVITHLIDEKLVDYIAMDYKFPSTQYEELVGVAVKPSTIIESRDIIMSSGIDHEFRVTVVEELFSDPVIKKISEELKDAKKVVLQAFRNQSVHDKAFEAYSNTTHAFLEKVQKQMGNAVVRD